MKISSENGLLMIVFSWLARDTGFPLAATRLVVENWKSKHALKIAECKSCGILSGSHGGHLMFIETPEERITLYGKGAGGINPANVEGLMFAKRAASA